MNHITVQLCNRPQTDAEVVCFHALANSFLHKTSLEGYPIQPLMRNIILSVTTCLLLL